ncbi:hypothetical protein IW140_000548 [Coemansia sp. RSA 1813]|nr:hypothetical protein EV178_002723 [Coemansia sp. RSA 1646]KAJ1774015.1 hypothetical protein LPJ74_000114 [Coemansia sp. RSA 1843]KAJ2092594.1 hypothetical protein IW138_001032 [Coemansia sp. RSA 986]KAJ2216711.1 hypothetical protein EV179_001001 [Coemansia sp. RSA 487]KAJ2572785.1 hypothetical protein IW140_000548 [Coemansia sp. RSA 1813]
MKTSILAVLAALLASSTVAAEASGGNVPVYKAEPYLTAKNTNFGNLIEGAAVDKDGNFYAVHYNSAKTATGKAYTEQSVFFDDKADASTWFNAIRFNINSQGAQEAYLGDAANKRVIRVQSLENKCGSMHAETFCQNASILQPNDLAIAPSTGRLFLSGMKYTADSVIGDGDLWTCDSKGTAKKLGDFYRTNGIEVSPDEKTLYLSEAANKGSVVVSNVIYAFDLDPKEGTISNKRTFADFAKLDNTAATDIDGMRTDTLGNLYVTRNGLGKVAKLSPSGELLAYIEAASITGVGNLEFAGPEGKDLYIVGACTADATKGCVDKYASEATGNAFNKLKTGGSS